jgi:glutamate N-acetyltransferase/amino-acid N-acetyltransferase
VDGGITAAKGFRAGSVAVPIRYEGRDDLALVVAEGPCAVAGVFTSNRAQAAPVIVSREHVAGGVARAVVVNAGCANCGTGAGGLADARAMAEAAAKAVDCPPQQVVVASTGVIGPRLPMDKVLSGIARAAGVLSGDGAAAAKAIMTTDTRPKEAAVTNGRYTIGGMCKGVGMIHPNMATMLAFVTSDAPVAAADLRPIVKRVADRTFNMVTVDGDESTNDTFVVMTRGDGGIDPADFEAGLTMVCTELAKKIAADGEGATRLLEVVVQGAASEPDARKAARAVVGSSLVKTAVFGQDANWGRILCALGYSGAEFNVEDVDLSVGEIPVAARGVELPFDDAAVSKLLGADVVRFNIRLGGGAHGATAWGCDLSYDYVKINGSYRT